MYKTKFKKTNTNNHVHKLAPPLLPYCPSEPIGHLLIEELALQLVTPSYAFLSCHR